MSLDDSVALVRRYVDALTAGALAALRTAASALGPDLPVLGGAALAFERLISEPEWYAPTRLGHRARAAGPAPASLTSLPHG